MNDLITRHFNTVLFHEPILDEWAKHGRLDPTFTTLIDIVKGFLLACPIAEHLPEWPPVEVLLPRYKAKHPVRRLYHLLKDLLEPCGYSVACLRDMEHYTHDFKRHTRLSIPESCRLYSLH